MAETFLGATLTTELRYSSSSTSQEERIKRRNCMENAFRSGMSWSVGVNEVDISASVPVKGKQGSNSSVNGKIFFFIKLKF